jgi:hypothetical protein
MRSINGSKKWTLPQNGRSRVLPLREKLLAYSRSSIKLGLALNLGLAVFREFQEGVFELDFP